LQGFQVVGSLRYRYWFDLELLENWVQLAAQLFNIKTQGEGQPF